VEKIKRKTLFLTKKIGLEENSCFLETLEINMAYRAHPFQVPILGR